MTIISMHPTKSHNLDISTLIAIKAYATYFTGLDAADLATAIREWLSRYTEGNVPETAGMPWQTWAQTAGKILECIGLVTAFKGVHKAQDCRIIVNVGK
ncbi:hypothetical protein [Acidiphilium sp. 20-67-58]|nr:hypothetical protein [Acidiphilium sp. 20-67-58]